MLEWVKQVNHFEKPIHPLLCKKNCIQHTVAPLLIEGKTGGVAVIGSSLVDTLLAFNQVSGAEIGLLIQDDMNHSENSSFIEPWNVNIAALTHKNKNQKILETASERFPTIVSLQDGIQVKLLES